MPAYTYALLLTIILGLLTNIIRFKGKGWFNRYIVTAGSAVTIVCIDFLYPPLDIEWFILLFIGIGVIAFRLYGTIFTNVLAVGYMMSRDIPFEWIEMTVYPLFAVSLAFLMNYIDKLRCQRQRRLDLSLHAFKQLNIFREVSYKIQQTRTEDQVLQIMLTAVTAGYGFSFNRAAVFLFSEDGNYLKGEMATGPLTPEEGFKTWQVIAENKYKLNDLFRMKETENSLDHPLNEKVRHLSLRLTGNTIAEQAVQKRRPIICRRIIENDPMMKRLKSTLQMKEFAVIPFFHQQGDIGVMFIDNPVSKKRITEEWVDQILPLTHQASVALYQSQLYKRIEEMAKKDGLTGLFNQWIFQEDIERYLLTKKQRPVSLILLDIDHFKVYNDTNGHLLGNDVLIQLADMLGSSVGTSGAAYRFGGEEFALLLSETSLVDAREIAEKIRDLVEKTVFPSESSQPGKRLTISVGVSSTEIDRSMKAAQFIELADEALYEAKNSGKNKVVATEEYVL
ncbi:GGDEF domain-containing protein [Salimicrobium flavidum]|uniref:Diguanylate cyclase (GGDEF) domain-containing protein n=1 Tax=Salimicrobium flavidum TaxID=570947 RepID=A0A1N7IRQ4_9BACI|nr:GGDEF domain-containing protein [Salimicrobium flavidum]SIS39773.1 diguanylate cyclase (GGDEF) domain-containing protein [Salimicrobium flavidum]